MQVLKKAAEKRELVTVALNTHGTRAVQKLIETLTTREQVCCAVPCCCIQQVFAGGMQVS